MTAHCIPRSSSRTCDMQMDGDNDALFHVVSNVQ